MGLEPKQAASVQAEHLTGGTLGPGAVWSARGGADADTRPLETLVHTDCTHVGDRKGKKKNSLQTQKRLTEKTTHLTLPQVFSGCNHSFARFILGCLWGLLETVTPYHPPIV